MRDKRLIIVENKDFRASIKQNQIPLGKKGGRGHRVFIKDQLKEGSFIYLQAFPGSETSVACVLCNKHINVTGTGRLEKISLYCNACVA